MKNTVLDHITITAPTLEAGAELIEKSLGVAPQKGGEHPRMGTHNLFLRLGDTVFLEVIASNPRAKKPDRPRWFALDDVTTNTLAQLKTWVVRTENIHASLEQCSEDIGVVEPMSRGDVNWQITFPKDGSLAFDGAAPALIQWQVENHPASNFNDLGLSLSKLEIYHPESDKLAKLLGSIHFEGNVELLNSDTTKMIAFIDTPNGMRELSL